MKRARFGSLCTARVHYVVTVGELMDERRRTGGYTHPILHMLDRERLTSKCGSNRRRERMELWGYGKAPPAVETTDDPVDCAACLRHGH